MSDQTTTRARKQEGRFRQFVEIAGGSDGSTLPLVHTTTAFSFADICEDRTLKPVECQHFEEELIYLFYGRPSYRVEDSVDSELEFNYPVIFIFEPSEVEAIKSVYPFDSGAFFLKLYAEFFSKKNEIQDFELPGNLDSARKLVETFYGSPDTYFYERSKKNIEIPHMNFEAQGVQRLSQIPPLQSNRDERSSTIEIQVEKEIEISEAALAIILPQIYLEIGEVVEALDYWNIDIVRPYRINEHFSIESQIGQIYELVTKIYKSLGFLKE